MKVVQSNTKIMFEYDESGRKKYLHRIIWDESKEKATVIMLSAGSSEGIYFDRTTCNVLRNLMQLGFGSADIVNLSPLLTVSLFEVNGIAEAPIKASTLY